MKKKQSHISSTMKQTRKVVGIGPSPRGDHDRCTTDESVFRRQVRKRNVVADESVAGRPRNHGPRKGLNTDVDYLRSGLLFINNHGSKQTVAQWLFTIGFTMLSISLTISLTMPLTMSFIVVAVALCH